MAKKKTKKSVPELDMALEVSNIIDLKDIALIENRCKLFPVSRSDKGRYNYTVSATTDFAVEDENDILLTQVRMKFKANNAKDENLLLLEATYIAVYSLKTKKEFSSDHYTYFAKYCSVFHIWPYLREFVQRSIAGFGMPPLTLPVYKFGTKLPDEDSLVSKKQIEQKERTIEK
ncbi:MAG: protein-export chaperone SecB [Sedimentisphaerales bacterium]|nr:protein-export chaperone SecB [Sedimentisphaerales bacterium]